MPRTTADLINELEQEAQHFTGVVLVVGFEDHTEMIASNDPKRLQKLNTFVQSGGEPVALIGYDFTGDTGSFYSRVLEEYKDESWVQPYLRHLMESVQALLSSTPGIAEVRHVGQVAHKDGWKN